MSEENAQAPTPEETPSTETEKPKATWEYKKRFGIIGEMEKVIDMTLSATQAEIKALKRKLDKLTYGN